MGYAKSINTQVRVWNRVAQCVSARRCDAGTVVEMVWPVQGLAVEEQIRKYDLHSLLIGWGN